MELIGSHPDITCENEIFNYVELFPRCKLLSKAIRLFPMPYLNYRVRKSGASIYGFKLFFFQVLYPEKFLTQLAQDKWKFVHLYRENLLQICLSNIIALRTNHWHRRTGNEVLIKYINIHPDRLLKAIKLRVEWRAKELELMKKHVRISLIYEHDLINASSWQKTADRVFEYLGLPSHKVNSTMKTTYQKPYSEIISNYDELINTVKNSEFAYLLESE